MLQYIVFMITLVAAYEQCKSVTKFKSKWPSDYYVTVLLPLYANAPYLYGLKRFELLKYLLYEFNQRSSYKIGYEVFDTCGESQLEITTSIMCDLILDDSPNQSKSKAFTQNHPNNTCSCHNITNKSYRLGIIGPSSSSVSEKTSHLVSSETLSLISYAATSPILSNKNEYPNFLRTIPSDSYKAQVIVDLILRFKWNYISVIASDNAFGRAGAGTLLQLFQTHDICVAIHALFDVPYNGNQINEIIRRINTDEKAHVIVLFAVPKAIEMFLKHATELLMYKRTWIFSETPTFVKANMINKKVVEGSFFVKPIAGFDESFKKYFWGLNRTDAEHNPLLKVFFDKYDATTGDESDSFESLSLGDLKYADDHIGFSRNALVAYLVALQNFVADKCAATSCQNYPPIIDRVDFNNKYLKAAKFKGLFNETIQFDEHGDVSTASYLVQNVLPVGNNIELRTVGKWQTETRLKIEMQNIVWSTTEKPKSQCSDKCLPGFYSLVDASKPCCWKCIKCPRGLVKAFHGFGNCTMCPTESISDSQGITCIKLKLLSLKLVSVQGCVLLFSSFIGILGTLFVLFSIAKFRDTKLVKSGNLKLSTLQLLFQLILFMFLPHFIFENTQITCMTRIYVTCLLLNAVLSIILVKIEVLLRIFSARLLIDRSHARRTSSLQCAITSGTTLFYVFVQSLLHMEIPIEAKYVIDTEEKTVFRSCDYKVHLMLTICHLLIVSIICGLQAYRARRLPNVFTEVNGIMYAAFTSAVLMVLQLIMTQYGKDPTNSKFLFYILVFFINICVLLIMNTHKVWLLWFKLRTCKDQIPSKCEVTNTFAMSSKC